MPFVRSLFLLGTPNVGAIRTIQLALGAQLAHAAMGAVSAIFPRKAGILDLTRAGAIFETQLGNAENASNVDYISIPGLYFHEGRGPLEVARHVSNLGFVSLDISLRVFSALFPFWSITIDRPHDGIVERKSNNLIPHDVGRESEKGDSILYHQSTPATYAHVEPNVCRGLTHLDIHNDPVVTDIVADIILCALAEKNSPHPGARGSGLEYWVSTFSSQQKINVRVAFG
jgi:hypothetical protein